MCDKLLRTVVTRCGWCGRVQYGAVSAGKCAPDVPGASGIPTGNEGYCMKRVVCWVLLGALMLGFVAMIAFEAFA